MIPNVFHFVFGMAEDFGGKPFSLSHYIAVKSAADINTPEKIFFHYTYEPSGEWWEKTKQLVTLNKVEAPDVFRGNKIYHVAHKADVIRLQMLKEHGGIYLDLDTVCVKPLHHLFQHSFVIGQELKAPRVPKNFRQKLKQKIKRLLGGNKHTESNGLCNAVMLAEPNSRFVNLWLDEYKTFRSKGRDKYWNEHSVFVPQQLATKFPDAVTILGPYTFHYPLYNEEGLYQMFETVTDFPEALAHHLWESFSWQKYLKDLTPEIINNTNSTYCLLARKHL